MGALVDVVAPAGLAQVRARCDDALPVLAVAPVQGARTDLVEVLGELRPARAVRAALEQLDDDGGSLRVADEDATPPRGVPERSVAEVATALAHRLGLDDLPAFAQHLVLPGG